MAEVQLLPESPSVAIEPVLLSLLPGAAVLRVPPRLLQLLQALKGSLGDVKSWVDLPEAGLSDQRQAAQSQVGVERV